MWRAFGWVLFAAVMFALFGLPLYIVIAHARDGGDWSATPADVREWMRTLMQPDNPTVPCCGEADAYEADSFEVEGDHYVAIITAQRTAISVPVGTRIPVPNHKMKFDAGNPTGHGIIFIAGNGAVLCYVAPGGI